MSAEQNTWQKWENNAILFQDGGKICPNCLEYQETNVFSNPLIVEPFFCESWFKRLKHDIDFFTQSMVRTTLITFYFHGPI